MTWNTCVMVVIDQILDLPYFQMLCCSNHTLRRPSPQSISSSPLSPHVLVQKMNSWANQTLPFPSCSKLVYITATGVIDSHPHNVLSSATLLLFCSPAAVVTICSRENQWPKRGSRDRELAFLERGKEVNDSRDRWAISHWTNRITEQKQSIEKNEHANNAYYA